jgi:hypothetical protein
VSNAIARTPPVRLAHLLHPAVELDRVEDLRPRELPRVAELQPVFGVFDLPSVLEPLLEQAELVTDPVAVAGQPQGRHAVEEAGGEASEAAVAESGVRLGVQDLVEGEPDLRERAPALLLDAEVRERAVQEPPDQELEGKIVDPLRILLIGGARRVHPAIDDPVPDGERNGVEPVAPRGRRHVLAHGVGEPLQEGSLERLDVQRLALQLPRTVNRVHGKPVRHVSGHRCGRPLCRTA